MKWLELGEFCSGKGPRKITAIHMLDSCDIFWYFWCRIRNESDFLKCQIFIQGILWLMLIAVGLWSMEYFVSCMVNLCMWGWSKPEMNCQRWWYLGENSWFWMILMLVTGELCITILEGKACPEAKTADLGLELRLRFEDCENVQFTVHWQFINTCLIRYPVHKLIICAVSWVPTDECSISSPFLVGFPGDQARKAQVNHSKQIKAAL